MYNSGPEISIFVDGHLITPLIRNNGIIIEVLSSLLVLQKQGA